MSGESSGTFAEIRNWIADFRPAIVGGAAAMVVMSGSVIAVGQVSGSEGRVLLESMFPTTRFLCSAVMTVSATILALMLTVMTLSHDLSSGLSDAHWRRMKVIAQLDTLTFVGATMVLLFHSVPLNEGDNVPHNWYSAVYYGLIGATSVIGGMLITIVLMLYRTTHSMIHVLAPGLDAGGVLADEGDAAAATYANEEEGDAEDTGADGEPESDAEESAPRDDAEVAARTSGS